MVTFVTCGLYNNLKITKITTNCKKGTTANTPSVHWEAGMYKERSGRCPGTGRALAHSSCIMMNPVHTDTGSLPTMQEGE